MLSARGKLAIGAIAAALIGAAPASAATVSLGKIAPPGVPGGCGGCSFLQLETDPATTPYAVPPGGPWTITSWSARGGPTMPDVARLLVFRPTGAAGQYRLIANSADVSFGVVEAPVTGVSIAVQPGDLIGLRTLGSGDMPTNHPSSSIADVLGGVMGNLMFGQTVGPGGDHPVGQSPFSLANVSATLTAPEPAKKKCKKKKRKKQVKGADSAAKKKKRKCKKRKRKKPKA